MNRCEAIRAVIAGKSLRVSEIVAALPGDNVQRIREAIGLMFRAKILSRTGTHKDGFAYAVARPVKLKRFATEEARRAGKRLTDAAHNRRRKRPMDQWRAEQRAKIEARELQRQQAQAERIARQQAREQARQQAAQERAKPVPTPTSAAKVIHIQVQRLAPVQPPTPVLQRMESISEFLARGGRIDRLPGPWEQQLEPDELRLRA